VVHNIVRYSLIFLILVIPSVADFKDGLDAYDRADYATALKEWQPIAERGDPNAQYNLGLMFALGHGVPKDYQKAADWYRKAAEQGVAAAQYNLGVMFANGQGVAQNNEEATKWFLKAAGQGIDNAEINLGDLYAEGEGASKNYAEAEKWYRKAAERGVASAAFNLGVMYDLGQGVTRDYDEAIKWYTKAADAGYAPALTNLGILYYNAQGVKRDLVQAYAWLARAQKLGDPRAAELFRTTETRMKPKDIKAAQALVDQWHPAAKPAPDIEEAKLFKQPETAPAAAVPAQSSADRAAQPAPEKAPAAPPASGPRPQDAWGGAVRIVAIGDVHGDYEQFVKVLESAGLIDGAGDWTGGRAHLVQTGDVVDRGPDSRAAMDLLMKLEKQAEEAGGGVHVLIGNHEAMDIYGDLRFVSPAEFAAFRTERSEASRQSAYEEYRKTMTVAAKPDEDRSQWESQHPPGFVEHRAAFAAGGVYGAWIRSHNAVIKIGRTLFVHAGLGPKYADWTLDQINDVVRLELNDFSRLHGGVAIDEDGPLWYRGFAEGNESQLESQVDRLLKHFDVDRIVVGHAYANGAITPRFHGKVLLVDIGLSRIYENTGKLGCLEIDEEHPYALHRGRKIELPKDENGPDTLRYLKEAAALDPQPSPLTARIQELEARQNPR
jgi:TPR repeat protein